nr:tyrosine decarboxylase 1 [Ipomoea trifida]
MRKNRRQAVVTVTTFSSDYTIQELYYGTAGGMVPRGRLLTVADTVGEQIRAMQSMNAPFPYSAVRDKILRVVGKELIGKLVVYASDQTHSTLQKAFQENKGAKFSKYELISSAIAGLTLQSLYLRWFKLRKAPVLPSNNLNYAENFLFMLDSLYDYFGRKICYMQANILSQICIKYSPPLRSNGEKFPRWGFTPKSWVGNIVERRRKSCSNESGHAVVPDELSGEFLGGSLELPYDG